MGFLSGGVTWMRYRPESRVYGFDGELFLQKLKNNAAGTGKMAPSDGIEVGWSAGDDVLDTNFSLEKNVIGDVVVCDLHVETDKLPGDLLKATYNTILRGYAAQNPSGKPSARQRKAAREEARDELELLAKDGRFKKRKTVPFLWDLKTNDVLIGSHTYGVCDRFRSLFDRTFSTKLLLVSADRADDLTELSGDHEPFIEPAYDGIAWIPDDRCRQWLGNEFLLWLWFMSDGDGETVNTPRGEITYMIHKAILLDCPRGQTGSAVNKHEGPSRLPETKRAAKAGKLPRKSGLIVVRHDQQTALTLSAETLAVSGAKLPKIEAEGLDANGRRHARVEQVRELIVTLDELYSAFLTHRASAEWPTTHARIKTWLAF